MPVTVTASVTALCKIIAKIANYQNCDISLLDNYEYNTEEYYNCFVDTASTPSTQNTGGQPGTGFCAVTVSTGQYKIIKTGQISTKL